MSDRKTVADILLEALKCDFEKPRSESEEDEEEDEDCDDDDYDYAKDDDYRKAELACPFCLEDYDVLGLCCHIDSEHWVETNSGICPLCAKHVKINMAAHVISQHESLLKAISKKKLQKCRGRSDLFSLRKELQNLNLHLHLKESSRPDSRSNVAADPLLLSFVNSPQSSNKVESAPAENSSKTDLLGRSEHNNIHERGIEAPQMDKDQAEKVQRCEFVQGILLSTFLDDNFL